MAFIKQKPGEGIKYDRVFVKPETSEIFDNILLHDKTKSANPHRVFLLDLYHEAALLLAKKRGISV